MSWTWIIFGIIIVASTIIMIIKKFGRSVKLKTFKSTKAQTPTDTPAPGGISPPTDHANSSSKKSKENLFSKIFWTIATIFLIVAALVFLVWAGSFIKKGWKELFKPSPKYQTVFVYDRTVTVNLEKDWSDANTVYLIEGEKCTFKEATVSFCVKNRRDQIVCGEPGTDPNLPNGDSNLKLWFKSQYGQSGTIKIDVYRRERRRVN